MFTFAILPDPTPAVELGSPFNPDAMGRTVTLFGGMRGMLTPCPFKGDAFSIFTVTKSGARYVINTVDAKPDRVACSGVNVKTLRTCGRPAHGIYTAIGEPPRSLCAAHGRSNWARMMGLTHIGR